MPYNTKGKCALAGAVSMCPPNLAYDYILVVLTRGARILPPVSVAVSGDATAEAADGASMSWALRAG